MSADSDVGKAAAILRDGGIVAFPTETVYGLGADATKAAAVLRIFSAKGRPRTNPLIVHVLDANVARRYARLWPDEAGRLTARFWPGPLTLVVPRADVIALEATAGLETVGLRSPNHPLAIELLRQFDGPIAAPSANRSTRVSPTTAGHVYKELGGAVDLILEGGPCQVGIESTVLDLTTPRPTILRPGHITQQQIEQVVGAVNLFHGSVGKSEPAHSPGQQLVHYSPAAPAWRFVPEQASEVARWCREHPDEAATILRIGSTTNLAIESPRHRIVMMPAGVSRYAGRLYATLHEADASGAAGIFIELPPDIPEWAAVRDRIIRATRKL